MKLAIYTENKQNLTDVGFVKDTLNQIKIRDTDTLSYEFKKSFGLIMAEATIHIGIKEPLTQIQKDDISKMILMRFKGLSLDEIAYAFRLERYNAYDQKTNHFQLFNAEYVSAVLDKYVVWKRQMKKTHQIEKKPEEVQVSEEEKQRLINSGVLACLKYYEENEMMDDRLYVYDVLFERGYLPVHDTEFRNEMTKAAQEFMEMTIISSKAKTRDEHSEKQNLLEKIKSPNEPLVKKTAKKLIVEQFFRGLTKDKKELKTFKKQFKIE